MWTDDLTKVSLIELWWCCNVGLNFVYWVSVIQHLVRPCEEEEQVICFIAEESVTMWPSLEHYFGFIYLIIYPKYISPMAPVLCPLTNAITKKWVYDFNQTNYLNKIPYLNMCSLSSSFLFSSLFFNHKASLFFDSLPHTHLDQRAWKASMFQAPERQLNNKQRKRKIFKYSNDICSK